MGSTVTENEQDRSPSCSCEHKVVVWPQISRYQSSVIFLFCLIFRIYYVPFQNVVALNVLCYIIIYDALTDICRIIEIEQIVIKS